MLTTWSLPKLTPKFKKVTNASNLGFWKTVGISHNNVRFAKEEQVV